MTEKTLVPIFVLWALLTVITPTLILLSENSKADLDFNGNRTEAMKVRRMIGHDTENHFIRTPPEVAAAAAKLVVAEEELASEPAPAPAPAVSLPLPSHSHHNHTKSNTTDDELILLSTNVHVQVKQAKIR